MTTATVAPPAQPVTPGTPAGSPVVEKLRAKFPEAVQDVTEFRGETTIAIRPEDLLNVCRFLRDDPVLRFNMLVDVSSYDRLVLGKTPRFVTVYHLLSLPTRQRLRLTAGAPGGDNPVLPSVSGIWPAANWLEREVYDLMGVRFSGHPDLRRILMPYEWVGHPLRKDYDTGAEAVPFTVTWNDPEFASLGKQILPAELGAAPVPPGLNTERSDHMVLNMGPQHPATHGVLRIAVELDGERVVNAIPDLGYLHSGFEKQAEQVRWKDFVYYTDRTDYVSAMSNNLGYSMTVEKLLGLEIPPRAQVVRVIMAELQRIASHLVWLGTHVMDISGTIMSLLMYAFREREQILDVFELCCGARLTTSYLRIGGLWKDVPPAFVPMVRNIVETFPRRFDEYERMLTDSPLWKERVQGIGKISLEDCIALGVTGPLLRASGLKWDLRKDQPYCGYENYDFEIPSDSAGDTYARYLVRMAEMRQSIRIIQQALDNLPDGPYRSTDRKVVAPPRAELDTSMEALIHHFKLWTEGFSPPAGMVYHEIENPKGQLGYFIVSDGTPRPYRCHIRGPSFVNLQALPTMSKGEMVADLVAIIGTIDVVLGEVDR